MDISSHPRSERLTFPLPILYRLPGEDHWWPSRVVNISESGVLFGPAALNPGTPVEVLLSLPRDIGTLAAGKQVFVADVVRTTESGAAAIRLGESRFLLEP
jgi:hypothetical protein